jgi:hypothetical protein
VAGPFGKVGAEVSFRARIRSCEIGWLGVIATNIFEQMENQWLLIHHHGSSVSNLHTTKYFFLIFDYDLC